MNNSVISHLYFLKYDHHKSSNHLPLYKAIRLYYFLYAVHYILMTYLSPTGNVYLFPMTYLFTDLFIYVFVLGCLSPFPSFFLHHLQAPPSGNHQVVLCIYVCFCSCSSCFICCFYFPHVSEIILRVFFCLTYFT